MIGRFWKRSANIIKAKQSCNPARKSFPPVFGRDFVRKKRIELKAVLQNPNGKSNWVVDNECGESP
jgi:hypothetical protein